MAFRAHWNWDFLLPEGVNGKIASMRLQEANIHLAIRNEALRISPSFYNDQEEIEAMLNALP